MARVFCSTVINGGSDEVYLVAEKSGGLPAWETVASDSTSCPSWKSWSQYFLAPIPLPPLFGETVLKDHVLPAVIP
jgi:hypothetical protein